MASDTYITPGRRPSIAEVRAYYARTEVLNEILQAMQRWHVRYVPGYAPSEWLHLEDVGELYATIAEALDGMEREPQRTRYPYLRIYGERHRPAHDWEGETLWGYDLVIEKDAWLWQECFAAMLPVMDVLEHWGVYYWLKYTGHHSLHLVIPAEVFPRTLRGVPLQGRHEALYHRLMVFLNKRARQPYNEHDRHCPPGTNMPYSVNEDTGLLNYPLLREELADFRPWQASMHLAPVRDFWRVVPEEARGQAGALLEEVLSPFERQARVYPAAPRPAMRPARHEQQAAAPGAPAAEQGIAMLGSHDPRARRFAAWALMRGQEEAALPTLQGALADEDADVRWFAAEAMFRFGPFEAIASLLEMEPDDMACASLADFCVKWDARAVPFLIQALSARLDDWQLLEAVAGALAQIGDASKPALEALRKDGVPEVRGRAAEIVDRLSGTPSLERLLDMSRSRRDRPRQRAAHMLAWHDEPQACERLIELARDGNVRVRKEAIKALGWVDHPGLEPVFRQALADPSAKVRRWAQQGLDAIAALAPLR
jgi:HEAT repeat protein